MNIKEIMKFKVLSSLVFIILTIGTQSLFAQSENIEITGQVVDSQTGQAIEFSTVMISDKSTLKTITGTTTEADGRFVVESGSKDIIVEISFIGFTTKIIDDFKIIGNKLDLGTITLSEDSKTLDEVVIRAEKSTTEFKLDKRVFNVGKDLSTTGASALDVLNNVPSVNVNIEGEISLRGSSGVQILINGKPSIIASEEGNALGTITADMIDKIEVITNPSAKYEAEGTPGSSISLSKKRKGKGSMDPCHSIQEHRIITVWD